MGKPKHGSVPMGGGKVKHQAKKKQKLFEIELVDELGKDLASISYTISFEGGPTLNGTTNEEGIFIHTNVPEKYLDNNFEISLKGIAAPTYSDIENETRKAKLSMTPSIAGRVERGSSVKVTVGNVSTDLRIQRWMFIEEEAKVTRPKKEDPDNWQKNWEGVIVTSGFIVAYYDTRKKVEDTPEKVKWQVTAWNKNPPAKHRVEVAPRTSDDWKSIVQHDTYKYTYKKGQTVTKISNTPVITEIQAVVGKNRGKEKEFEKNVDYKIAGNSFKWLKAGEHPDNGTVFKVSFKERATSQISEIKPLPKGYKPKAPPSEFKDLGLHYPYFEPRTFGVRNPKVVTLDRGPNKSYTFVETFELNIHSCGFVNDDLLKPDSKFSKAQDGNVYFTIGNSPKRHLVDKKFINIEDEEVAAKNEDDFLNEYKIPLYLTRPKPRRKLANEEWTVSGGNTTLTNELEFCRRYKIPLFLTEPEPRRAVRQKDWTISEGNVIPVNELAFRKRYKIPDDEGWKFEFGKYELLFERYRFLFPIIKYDDLLKNTRRHEYDDAKSHRGNFEKVIRALLPKEYAESIISRPGKNKNLSQKIVKHLDKISKLENGKNSHKIVDEEATKVSGNIEYLEERILDINVDDKGVIIGNVWNPQKNKAFPRSSTP